MNQTTKSVSILDEDARDDDLCDAARLKIESGEPLTKAEANAYFAASLHNPTNQVYFRAGLIACREYMARFVEAESSTIAASIRANWWPQLGKDYGPPRLLQWDELAEGEPQNGDFRVKTENWTPTLEALPIALAFLQRPIPGPASEEAHKAEHTHGVMASGMPQLLTREEVHAELRAPSSTGEFKGGICVSMTWDHFNEWAERIQRAVLAKHGLGVSVARQQGQDREDADDR